MLHGPIRITAAEHPNHGQGPVPKLSGWAGGGSCWQKSLQLTKTNHKPRVHLILQMEINQGKVPSILLGIEVGKGGKSLWFLNSWEVTAGKISRTEPFCPSLFTLSAPP